MRKIQGMVIVITGASAGIGRELARQLSAQGAKLILSARRIELLDQLNQELGGGHLTVRADVSQPEDCQSLIDQAQSHFGRIDTLVCNAGYGLVQRVYETTAIEARQIFATNVFGAMDCIRPAVPLMLNQPPRDGYRGQIVFVSSGAARRGLPYFGAYSATKAAQLSLAEALRVELKPDRIAVTSIHPIGTETDFFATAAQVSHRPIPRRAGSRRQSTARVAAAIVKSIQFPKPEVWTSRLIHWGLAINAIFPSLSDRALASHRRAMQRGELKI